MDARAVSEGEAVVGAHDVEAVATWRGINLAGRKETETCASAATFGRAGAFVSDQPPRRIFVGPGVAPDIFLAVIAEAVKMHFAVVGRPETRTNST